MKFGDPLLGLPQPTYRSIASQVDVIIHAAWAVNFSARLASFEHDNTVGLHYLLSLALDPLRTKRARFVFCSSVASVALSETARDGIPESISERPSDASPLGYSRSKWVAETICARAAAAAQAAEPHLDATPETLPLAGESVADVQTKAHATPVHDGVEVAIPTHAKDRDEP